MRSTHARTLRHLEPFVVSCVLITVSVCIAFVPRPPLPPTQDFQRVLDDFITSHGEEFEGLTEDELSGKDNSVKYHESYQKFLSAYEGELEGFLKDEGVTGDEFTALCEQVRTEREESLRTIAGSRRKAAILCTP